MPSNNTSAGCQTTQSRYLATLTVTNGVIAATSQNTGASPECSLTLTPTVSGAEIPTVLGPISYDAKGDIRQPGFVVFEWKQADGKLGPVAY